MLVIIVLNALYVNLGYISHALVSMQIIYLMRRMNGAVSTKRIQHARGWCATVGGTVQIVSTYPASPEARPPIFGGKPAVRPRSMAGDIESNPGPKPTLKTLSHTHTLNPHTYQVH